MLGASQVLPILLNPSKLAFFYQFKDNHIYNFDFRDTFIEEIALNAYVLEIAQQ